MKIRTTLLATLPIVILFIFPGFSQNIKFCPTVEKQWLISTKDQIIKDLKKQDKSIITNED